MSFGRSWGSHYSNGDLVISRVNDELVLAVVIGHSGDYFHDYMRVNIENDPTEPPSDSDHLVGVPDEQYHDYWVGPKVGHLDSADVMRLSGGIDVGRLMLTAPVEQLLRMKMRESTRPKKK